MSMKANAIVYEDRHDCTYGMKAVKPILVGEDMLPTTKEMHQDWHHQDKQRSTCKCWKVQRQTQQHAGTAPQTLLAELMACALAE